MLQVDLTATVRKDFGKGANRRLRREGRTPAILYGPKAQPLALSIETGFFTKSLLRIHGQNAIVNIDVEDGKSKEKRHVMIREIQKDPVQESVVHADFLELSLDAPITLPVQIIYNGIPIGVDLGGILHIAAKTVRVKGLPLDLPDSIEADVTALELDGPGLTCKDLNIPGQVSLQEKLDMICARVVKPSVGADKSMLDSVEPEEVAAEAGADEGPPEKGEPSSKKADA